MLEHRLRAIPLAIAASLLTACSGDLIELGDSEELAEEVEVAFPGREGVKRVGLLPGLKGHFRAEYQVIDEYAVLEGDIIFDLEKVDRPVQHSAANPNRLWPNGVVPYTISSGLPNQQRVHDAVREWNEKSPLRLVARTNEANYIQFSTGSGCSSYVGMQGGKQKISLASGCYRAAVIHEIGHAIGLYHEQSRADRDRYIEIKWANIKPSSAYNFNRYSVGEDIGTYDYGSIMHYSPTAFSWNGRPTIVAKQTLPAGVEMGQRNGLSAGDRSAVRYLYGDGVDPGGNCTYACSDYSMSEGDCRELSGNFWLCRDSCLEQVASCGGGSTCTYACSDYGVAEGECREFSTGSWQCQSGCLELVASCGGSSCLNPCANFGVAEGECRDFSNGSWQCTSGCLEQVASCNSGCVASCAANNMSSGQCWQFVEGWFRCQGDCLSQVADCGADCPESWRYDGVCDVCLLNDPDCA